MEYKCDDIVYTYCALYNKLKNRYESLDFIRYKDNHTILESVSLSPGLNGAISNEYNFYVWYYLMDSKHIHTKRSCLMSDTMFSKPLQYFYNMIYDYTPNKIITKQLSLNGGFSVNEEIPYGFIYNRKSDEQTAKYAEKYGLKNTNEIDYGKLVSIYTVTDNEVLIINNRFMEFYNYIATKKQYGKLMTQEGLIKLDNQPVIYLNDLPTSIKIGTINDANHSIEAKYSNIGITTSMIIDGEEKCKYENDDIANTITSIHPLVYEPFCTELYKDIILDDLPYDVMEEYEETEEYIEYKRSVFKK